jgi:hypothetical protein
MAMIFERSPDTDAMIKVLRGCNDQISYQDMARQAGLSLHRAKSVLPSARRALRSDGGVLFGVIRGEGLKRLTDLEKVKKPEAFKKKVFRGAGREIKDLSTINFECLSKTDQHSVTTNRTVLNVLRQQAKVKPEPATATAFTTNPAPNVDLLIKSVA